MTDNVYKNNIPIGSADFVFKLCKDYMIGNTVPYNPNLPKK